MSSMEIYDVQSPERIVVIGDLHGDYSACVGALMRAGVISQSSSSTPEDYHKITWLKGAHKETHIVQMGDIFDGAIRCPNGSIPQEGEESILKLLMNLKGQARRAGGDVHLLTGNHEIMNMCLDFRYVSPKGFLQFEKYAPKDSPYCTDEARQEQPLNCGAHGRATAFSAGGAIRSLIAKNMKAALKLGDHLFVHAGISKETSERYNISEINQIFKSCLEGDYSHLEEFNDIFMGDRSIVWLRDYVEFNEKAQQDLSYVLDQYQAKYLYTGHNALKEGIQLKSLCDERGVWMVDPGLSGAFQGRKEILEVRGTCFEVISFDTPDINEETG